MSKPTGSRVTTSFLNSSVSRSTNFAKDSGDIYLFIDTGNSFKPNGLIFNEDQNDIGRTTEVEHTINTGYPNLSSRTHHKYRKPKSE